MRGASCGPVTITAISISRSTSGSSPVISQSSQTRLRSFLASVATGTVSVSDILAIVADGLNLARYDRLLRPHPGLRGVPRRRPGREVLAGVAADPPCGRPPRCRAGALRRDGPPGGPPESSGLHDH